MIAAVFIVSKSFSPPPCHPQQLVCSQPECQRHRRRIITGTKSLPTHFTGRSAGRVRMSGARPTLAIGSNTARTTLGKRNAIASGSNAVTRSAAC